MSSSIDLNYYYCYCCCYVIYMICISALHAMYVCAPLACLEYAEARKGQWIS